MKLLQLAAIWAFLICVFIWTLTAKAQTFPTLTTQVVVTIVDHTAKTSVYYTTDGSTPTTASTKYTAPFTLPVQAIVTVTPAVTIEAGVQAQLNPATPVVGTLRILTK